MALPAPRPHRSFRKARTRFDKGALTSSAGETPVVETRTERNHEVLFFWLKHDASKSLEVDGLDGITFAPEDEGDVGYETAIAPDPIVPPPARLPMPSLGDWQRSVDRRARGTRDHQ